nr:TetR/AcrR family transcriptional regulator [uncultured Methanoregula sp.]
MPKVVPEYKEEAKKKIIAAGLAVLSRKGYGATTMDDIAAHLGVSKGALYLYFRNKDDLVIEIVKYIHREVRDTARTAFPNNTPLDAWTALLDRFLENDAEYHAFFMEIMAMTVRNPAIRESFTQSNTVAIEMATHGIACQQSKGSVRQDADPRTLAIAIISVFSGLRSLALVGVSRQEIRERWMEIGRILLATPEGAVPAKQSANPCTCPWFMEMGQLMVERRDDVPFEIPACPDDCGNKKCTIRYEKKKK